MINLFEYQNKFPFEDGFSDLEIFLDEIWNKREKNSFYENDDSEKVETQRFIEFLHKTKELKSSKYVGVIHFEGHRINLLPKIFYDSDKSYNDKDIESINKHILWYLSYCRKIKFPNFISSLSSLKSDFFEVLIYLFSKYTRELLSSSIYQQYEEVNNELSNIKGRIDVPVYISENLSKGRWHKVSCSYDSFVMDNKFNRIIKYVTQLLFNVSKNLDNKKYLREILFILDEVSDVRATAEECSSLTFNPMFSDFETVRDYCSLFLSNSISFNYKNDLKLFAFLIPMEHLFEDFIFGFIDKELSNASVKSQMMYKFLDECKIFNLKPDLLIETKDKKLFIADTKYKIIYSDKSDKKEGVSQSDLYQMVSYAIRFNIQDIILFYPNIINQDEEKSSELVILDELADKKIKITIHQLPVINKEIFTNNTKIQDITLSEVFNNTRLNLKAKIISILTNPL